MTKPDIILYDLGPTRSARVRWILAEAGLSYIARGEKVGIIHSDELRQVHPLGKLPAVLINGQPLFESGAIVTAIADLVPEKSLIARPGTWARNLHYQWLCFILSEIEPYLHSAEINQIDFILPEDQHVPDIIAQNAMMFRKAAAALDAHLEAHDYLVENRFSATDIIAGYALHWAAEYDWLDGFPALEAYVGRLQARRHWPLPNVA